MTKKIDQCAVLLFVVLFAIPATSRGEDSTANPLVKKTLTPEMLSMPREQIRFEDEHVILFNGRGFINPRQYSITGLRNLQFPPVEVRDYDFHLDLLDTVSGTLIRDDVPALWDEYIRKGTGTDPLGANLRPNMATVLVTQDEVWQPNCYTRTGTFHKQYQGRWVSFALKSWSSVSGAKDEIFLKLELLNRTREPLTLTLIPRQSASRLGYPERTGSEEVKTLDPFTIGSDKLRVRLSSDIKTRNEKGYAVTLPPGSPVTFHFVIQPVAASLALPPLEQTEIARRMAQADARTRESLQWGADRLPVVESDYRRLDDLYRRCLLSVLECKWERENFIVNPFWTVGTWVFTISWDNSYASDVLAMLDPESLKEAVLVDLREVKMKNTYVSWKGAIPSSIYLQEPFALQIMIDAHILHTGSTSILNAKAGDATVYEWMKRWATRLHDHYGRPDGLIDVGPSAEEIIEIRTDGYNHVVPITNGLAVKLFSRMAEWARVVNDPAADQFRRWAETTRQAMSEKLWNAEIGWFDNLYPDGTRHPVWTYHLFDLLGSDVLTEGQFNRLVAHIRDGVFLGKYGLYSIARNDRVHWDRIDADWGGGGQYAGMPGRISRYLFQKGQSELAWDILNRYAGYVEYFPYLSQNPRTDAPVQDLSSMPLEISAGAGIEAILFGLFGMRPQEDGTLVINPAYHSELGTARMRDFRFRGHSYDVVLKQKEFEVYEDGRLLGIKYHGDHLVVNSSSARTTR
jgi:hypothetical protein